jgi:hypothetical protein
MEYSVAIPEEGRKNERKTAVFPLFLCGLQEKYSGFCESGIP